MPRDETQALLERLKASIARGEERDRDPALYLPISDQGYAFECESADLSAAIGLIEGLLPRPIEEAPAYDSNKKQKVLVIGGRFNNWELWQADGDWWRQGKREGLRLLPTHFIPLSALEALHGGAE